MSDGLKLEIYTETCCEVCNEVVHNHFDCPACGKKHSGSNSYYDLFEDSGNCTIQCSECKATFHTDAKYPYDESAIWKPITPL